MGLVLLLGQIPVRGKTVAALFHDQVSALWKDGSERFIQKGMKTTGIDSTKVSTWIKHRKQQMVSSLTKITKPHSDGDVENYSQADQELLKRLLEK